MLDEAMVRLDVDQPDLAIHAALKKFLEDNPETKQPETDTPEWK
jgi:hypothetical protein